jgi:hypothetical protein
MLANMESFSDLLKHALRMAAALALVCLAAAARADDLDDFNRAVEAAMSHHRVATGYLRTGNIDLATLEIENLREAWGKVSALPRPAAFRDAARYNAMVLESAAALIGTTLVLNMGRADVAREALDTMRKQLSELRRQSGVPVLADCVLDANVAMDALFALDGGRDWESAIAGAESYRATLQRCDAMAPLSIRNHAEFRRLIDGALASLGQIPKAAETQNADLLHRLLIELRSFDHLLAFRYG